MSKQDPRVHFPDEQTVTAWARLFRVQTRFLAAVHNALRAADLPPLAWYDVLLELHRCTGRGLRQFEIGERILLPKDNLSRLIDRLQREGLVERAACPEDGRGNIVLITKEGVALLKRMWPVYGAVIREQMEGKLTAAEIRTLGKLLKKLS